jgi:hypothetical protein
VASARYCIVIWLFHADFMKKLRTALLYACWVGSITAVKMLVKRRADLNIQNSVGALTATCVVSYAVKLRPLYYSLGKRLFILPPQRENGIFCDISLVKGPISTFRIRFLLIHCWYCQFGTGLTLL